jgi:hypothetical protein
MLPCSNTVKRQQLLLACVHWQQCSTAAVLACAVAWYLQQAITQVLHTASLLCSLHHVPAYTCVPQQRRSCKPASSQRT